MKCSRMCAALKNSSRRAADDVCRTARPHRAAAAVGTDGTHDVGAADETAGEHVKRRSPETRVIESARPRGECSRRFATSDHIDRMKGHSRRRYITTEIRRRSNLDIP